MQTIVNIPVTLTERAVTKIKSKYQPGFVPSQLLRVGVKGGGCSGLSYVMGFDHKQENDMEFELDNIHAL